MAPKGRPVFLLFCVTCAGFFGQLLQMIRKLLLGVHLLAKGADGLSSDELSFLTLLKNKLWITGTTCTTVGVTCDGALAITAIERPSSVLSGTVPSLTGLPELQTLTLYGNQMSGTFPEISINTKLRSL